MGLHSGRACVRAWLSARAPHELDALARRHAARAAAAGAVVHHPSGKTVSIPPLLTPECLAGSELAALALVSHQLVDALTRLTAWLMTDLEGELLRDLIFRSLTPLERLGLAGWRQAAHLATARVDYFVDDADHPRALEINATIPAMQGYSDIVAESFIRAVGEARALSAAVVDGLVEENGRNTDDLLRALLGHYRRLGGMKEGELTIAIVHRAGDAQLGELEHYARRFGELGHRVLLAVPQDIHLAGARLAVRGETPDLFYRHIFARRLDPISPFARACLEAERHRIFNPFSTHLEVKGLLALLSQALARGNEAWAETVGLDEERRTALARALPWTRLLLPGRTDVGPAGEAFPDLVAAVAAEPERFVLKRSWDYGGKSVFLGVEHDDDAGRRAARLLGLEESLAWGELVAAAARDPSDAWVVQELVPLAPRPCLIAGLQGAEAADLYVDLSVYTSLGTSHPRGGASRAAPGRIVNILGGGGLAPVIRDEVMAKLLG